MNAAVQLPFGDIAKALRRDESELVRRASRAHLDGVSMVRALARADMTNEELIVVYCVIAGIEIADPSRQHLPAHRVVELLAVNEITAQHVLPIEEIDGVITIATSDVPTPTLRTDLARLANGEIKLVFSHKVALDQAIVAFRRELDRHVAMAERADLIESSTGAIEEAAEAADFDAADYETLPVQQVVAEILRDAARDGASDVFLQPQPPRESRSGGFDLWIRRIVKGRLQEVGRIDNRAGDIVRAAKALAGLTSEQEYDLGSARHVATVDGREVEWRVSSLPTDYQGAPSIAFRRHEIELIPIAELGFDSEVYEKLIRITHASQGLVVLAGPVGSGKSTTIYSLLQLIAEDGSRNVLTAEDPVEHRIAGTVQSSINPARGYDYKDAHRQFMRMNPHVLFFGEIRDADAASVTIEAATTGHLVFSTTHVKRAYLAARRLITFIEPLVGRASAVSDVAEQLSAVLEQRLIGRLCPDCRREVPFDPSIPLPEGAHAPDTLYEEGDGNCDTCQGLHLVGRVAVGELLILNRAFKTAIREGAPDDELERIAVESGMVPVRTVAWRLALDAQISQSLYRKIAEEDVSDAVG